MLEPKPGDVLATVQSSPRVPARRPANLDDFTFHVTGGADLGMGPDSTVWTKQMMGTYVDSPPTSTVGSFKSSALALPPPKESDKE